MKKILLTVILVFIILVFIYFYFGYKLLPVCTSQNGFFRPELDRCVCKTPIEQITKDGNTVTHYCLGGYKPNESELSDFGFLIKSNILIDFVYPSKLNVLNKLNMSSTNTEWIKKYSDGITIIYDVQKHIVGAYFDDSYKQTSLEPLLVETIFNNYKKLCLQNNICNKQINEHGLSYNEVPGTAGNNGGWVLELPNEHSGEYLIFEKQEDYRIIVKSLRITELEEEL